MSKNKLFILLVVLILLVVNSGIASATTAPGPTPQPPMLSLKVTISPITIYPPLVLFTATVSRLPSSGDIPPVVDYFLVSPSLCFSSALSTGILCSPTLNYLGSAQVNRYGEAVFSQQMKAGAYTAVARINISGATIWSSNVSFQVP
jgi:hypothetical protein